MPLAAVTRVDSASGECTLEALFDLVLVRRLGDIAPVPSDVVT